MESGEQILLMDGEAASELKQAQERLSTLYTLHSNALRTALKRQRLRKNRR